MDHHRRQKCNESMNNSTSGGISSMANMQHNIRGASGGQFNQAQSVKFEQASDFCINQEESKLE